MAMPTNFDAYILICIYEIITFVALSLYPDMYRNKEIDMYIYNFNEAGKIAGTTIVTYSCNC